MSLHLPNSFGDAMRLRPRSSPVSWAIEVLVVAILYYAAARLGLLLAFEKTNASPVWPPAGIAFAAVLLRGYRVWPGIMLGAFLANGVVFLGNHAAHVFAIVAVSSGIGIGNTLAAALGRALLDRAAHYPLTFVPLPWLVWAAFRFGPREAATAAVLTSGIAVWETANGLGPFVRDTVNESLLLVQAFVGVVTVTILTMAALVGERRDAQASLLKAHDTLETEVDKRTRVLWQVNERLQAETTEPERASDALRSSEAKFRGVLEFAPDAMVIANHARDILLFNTQAVMLFGPAPA